MSRSKYEIFNIATGEFEEMDFSPDDFFDKLASRIAEESGRLYDMYIAEREIVRSIIEKATEDEKDFNRSTD